MININGKINTGFAIALISILAFGVSGYVVSQYNSSGFPSIPVLSVLFSPSSPAPVSQPVELNDLAKFASEEEFLAYLQDSSYDSQYYYGGAGITARNDVAVESSVAPGASPMLEKSTDGYSAERVSETNVQVLGIDEPDVVKTDGEVIYFSPQQGYYWRGISQSMIMPDSYYYPDGKYSTKVIGAFPPDSLAEYSKIDKSGNLLLVNDVLAVFTGNEIFGYDVSSPKDPKEIWKVELEDRSYLVGARLYNGKIYIVAQTSLNTVDPCPIVPLKVDGKAMEISCLDIYRPTVKASVDTVFNAMILDPEKGTFEKTVSFVGSTGNSLVYMSKGGIYATYAYQGSAIDFMLNFLKEKGSSIVPSSVIDKLEKLVSYDISDAAKMTEFGVIFEQYYNSLDNDERVKVNNDLTNEMSDYQKDHMRELQKTGIIKIGLDNFTITAAGSVPGTPLNQFSLDEYQGNLRVAVTVGGSSAAWWGNSSKTANDVYVLDKDLKETGSIKDLGLTERIYSARFIDDKGYLVTFRQTDPFYVLDLSDPDNPQMKGELKIPGYSSYLHPINSERILGIGQDSWKVKVSLFDVSSPSDPKEAAKYVLDESWTEVSNTHHAFLLDSKHQVFFMPGSNGGYIFSYKNDKLVMERAVTGIQAKRAIYLDDYLYIIGEDRIVVLDESNWKDAAELEFK